MNDFLKVQFLEYFKRVGTSSTIPAMYHKGRADPLVLIKRTCNPRASREIRLDYTIVHNVRLTMS